MKFLYNYHADEFLEFVVDNKLNNWWIYDGQIKDRYNSICNKEYCRMLKKMANKHRIHFDQAEIVSWLDGMSMVYYGLESIEEEKKYILDGLQVIGELHIPFSNCRADVVLVKDNKILIIEFSYKNKYVSRREQYEEKLNQVMYYKELLSNALPKHIEIATYSFIVEIEADDLGIPLNCKSEIYDEDDVTANTDNCYYLGRFIQEFFKNTNKSALDELEKISDDCYRKGKKRKFENK